MLYSLELRILHINVILGDNGWISRVVIAEHDGWSLLVFMDRAAKSSTGDN